MEERAEQGRRQLGRYSLHGEIASGGMATVYFGRLEGEGGFSRVVAIKCMHPHLANDPEFKAMFLDEARLAARIRHPNVVSTIDIGSGEGGMFLVMEYVNGESLATLIKDAILRGERVPTFLALRIVIDALYGLHAAHTATDDNGTPLSIVHRDVSPQNILVAIDGHARVLDFGIAKAAGRAHTTREGQLKGKFRYMAPEQIQDHGVTAKTDVYAMSVVLWELLTGEPLFRATNDAAIIARVLEGVIAPPSRLVEHISPELDAVVKRGLARNPDDRFPTAEAMAEALEPLCASTTARQVGTWVTHVARDSLQRRNEEIAKIDSSISFPTLPLPHARASLPAFAVSPAALMPMGGTVTATFANELTGFEATTRVRDVDRVPDAERVSAVVRLFQVDSRRAALVALKRINSATASLFASIVATSGPRGAQALAWWKSTTLPLTFGWRVVVGAAVIVTLVGAVTFRSTHAAENEQPVSAGIGTSAAPAQPPIAEDPPAALVAPPDPSFVPPQVPAVQVTGSPVTPSMVAAPVASAAPLPSASATAPAASTAEREHASHANSNGSNSARNKCAVPYFIDSSGIRRVKPQCI
jgi:serine/threonine-protein kinase